MREARIRSPIKGIIAVSTLLFCSLFMSPPISANSPVEFVHPRDYTSIFEETLHGERIQLDNSDIYAIVDTKSIIRITFDKEKLFEIARTLAKEKQQEENQEENQGKKLISIQIEAYVKPKEAQKYPITVEKYLTVIKKIETSGEVSSPKSKETEPKKKVSTISYEVIYHEKSLESFDPEKGQITGAIVDTYLDLASLSLDEGDRVYLTISDVETQYHISKTFEVKDFGLKVHLRTPVMLIYRLSSNSDAVLSPSGGATVVFKIVDRKIRWLEDSVRFGVNIAFLDFDDAQSIEIGLGLAVTIYNDFFEIGYGLNLNVKEDPQYWYIGLNVLQLPTFLTKGA